MVATVTSVAAEARDGVIRVELQLPPETPTAMPLQHGLPGTVEVEVERISPAALVLRAVGTRLGVSTRRAAATEPQRGALRALLCHNPGATCSSRRLSRPPPWIAVQPRSPPCWPAMAWQ